MPAVTQDFLNVARVNGIMQGLQDPRLIPQSMPWLKRIPIVPALKGEIMARFIGVVLIADMIADDARAGVYSQGKFQFETTDVPNLKIGTGIGQEMLDLLYRLQQGFAGPTDQGIFTNWENRTMENLLLGVRQRMNALVYAMLTDGLSYDRLGIKMSNVTWGMPADLKITVTTPWDDATNADGINDILTAVLLGKVRYNITFDRITMSTTELQLLVAQTKFQNKARMYLAPNVSFSNISLVDLPFMQSLVEQVTKMTVEIDDSRYWTQGEDGSYAQQPFLPITKCVLTSKSNDGSQQAWDFANCVVTETIVSSMAETSIIGGGFAAPAYGPVAYATPSNVDLNPPGLGWWAVAKGFPRKHILQSSAVLTTGTFTDSIPVGMPFPA